MSSLLAFDQASHTTGYSYFEDGKPIEVKHFTCTGSDLGKRLVQFRNKVIELIELYKPDEVVFEDIQLQERVAGKKNTDSVTTYKTLAEVYGVIQELLEERNIKYSAVQPNVWKATFKIAGKGRPQEKKMAQQEILNRYGLNCTEDEADSACIGTHILEKNNSFDWTE